MKKPGMAHGVSPRNDDVKLDGKEDEDLEVFHDMEQDDTTEGAGGAAEEKKAKSTSANAEVPSPAPSEPPEQKEKEEADWKFVSKRQIGGRRTEGRYSLMVTNAPLAVAEKLARNLFPEESRKKKLIWLDNKANSEWKLHEQVHRLSFLTLTDEQAQEKLIRNGLTAARLRQWVMLGPEWNNLCYGQPYLQRHVARCHDRAHVTFTLHETARNSTNLHGVSCSFVHVSCSFLQFRAVS